MRIKIPAMRAMSGCAVRLRAMWLTPFQGFPVREALRLCLYETGSPVPSMEWEVHLIFWTPLLPGVIFLNLLAKLFEN